MRLDPNNHITIEIKPYSAMKTSRHKNGCTHLVRVTERKPDFQNDERPSNERGVSTGFGKIVNIFEQEVTIYGSNELANVLRRYGDWQRPARSRKAKPGREVGFMSGHFVDAAEQAAGGYGSGPDYREA